MTLPVQRSSAPSSPVRWDPVREFEDLYQRMGQLWDWGFGSAGGGAAQGQAWSPLADLSETDDAYLVEVDLPGVKRDDVVVEMTGTALTVRGELKEKERVGLLRRHTRRTGEFLYQISLPTDVDAEHVSAELADGVLSVRVPKTETAKPRQIEVTTR